MRAVIRKVLPDGIPYNGALPDNLKDGVLGSNLDNYAWTWLIVGVILLVSSFLVIRRSQFAPPTSSV